MQTCPKDCNWRAFSSSEMFFLYPNRWNLREFRNLPIREIRSPRNCKKSCVGGAAKSNLPENFIRLILLERHWQYTFYAHAYVTKNSWWNEIKEIKANLPYFIIWSLVLLTIFSRIPTSSCTVYTFELVLKQWI